MKLYEDWPESIGLIVLLISFVFSLSTRYSLLNYFVVFLGGVIFGNLYYKERKRQKHAVAFIGIGFLIGFLLGNLYQNVGASLILFALGAWGSYHVHHCKYIVTR